METRRVSKGEQAASLHSSLTRRVAFDDSERQSRLVFIPGGSPIGRSEADAFPVTGRLPPHRDYPKAKRIFGDVDPNACGDEFVYGKDGKPFFIAGPHDGPSRCRQIIDTLTARCGAEAFTTYWPCRGR